MARRTDTEPVDDAPKKLGRIAQLRQTYRMAKKVDPKIGLWVLATFLVLLAIVVGLGVWLGPLWLWLLTGIPFALLVALVVFGRRAERAAYAQIEGQPGAAMSAVSTLRKGWTSTPAVGFTKQQDAVHRVTGRPGIVLIGEGNPQRVATLLAQETKRHARIAGDTPIHTVVAGTDDGQVTLRKLPAHLNKFPKALTPAEVTELNRRLKAMPTNQIPLPKGPLPKNAKVPRGGMPR